MEGWFISLLNLLDTALKLYINYPEMNFCITDATMVEFLYFFLLQDNAKPASAKLTLWFEGIAISYHGKEAENYKV